VMLASVPFDLQAHDTYFVVAHFHYVLVGGAVFPLFAAFYYWFPKLTGRLLGEGLGKLNFWLFFLGVNLTFFPMHWLGLMGMPRRVYTYPAGLGWEGANALATLGAVTIFASVVVFLVNVLRALRRPRHVPADPWGGETLEWAADSPPAPYNFAFPPVVEGRSALWSRAPDGPVVTGLRTDRRESLITTVLDAVPVLRYHEPGPTIAPLLAGLAVGVTFIVTIWAPWGLLLGLALLFAAMALWGAPRGTPPEEEAEERARHERVKEEERR
jgi:cytochrome c oxidase subunit I+III